MDNYLDFLINASFVYYFYFLFFLISPVVCATGIALGSGLWATSILFFLRGCQPGKNQQALVRKAIALSAVSCFFLIPACLSTALNPPEASNAQPRANSICCESSIQGSPPSAPSPSLLSGAAHTR